MELPFRGMVADRHALRANSLSMATEEDIRLARGLDYANFSKDTLYGMNTPDVGGGHSPLGEWRQAVVRCQLVAWLTGTYLPLLNAALF